MKVVAHIDGGSRGNPGPAAAGYLLDDAAGKRLQARAFFLGKRTNNVAEYTGLIKAMEAARALGATYLSVFSDSELLVRHLTGRYKVKSDLIRFLVIFFSFLSVSCVVNNDLISCTSRAGTKTVGNSSLDRSNIM